MSDLKNEQMLREIYYDPLTGYGSAEKLYRKAKEEHLTVSRQKVKDWFKNTRYVYALQTVGEET